MAAEAASTPAGGGSPGTSERKPWYMRIPPAVWGLAALFGGMALGVLFPEQLSPIGAGVKNGFNYLAKAAPFIIFLTLVPAIIDMLRTGSAAKFAGAVSIAFLVTTLLAGFWAVVLLVPIFRLEMGFTGQSVMTTVVDVASSTFTLALTSEPFIAIWFGTLVALFLHFGQKTRALEWFCAPTAHVYQVVGVRGVELLGDGLKRVLPLILLTIGVYIPTGVTNALDDLGNTLAISGALGAFADASPVTWYFISTGVMVLILTSFLAITTFAVAKYTGYSAKRIFKDYIAVVYPFAWATASSAATIPLNLERTEEALEVRKEVRDFIIPLGATVNLDGTMIGSFVVTVVAGILLGYPPTVLDLAILVIPLTIVSVGIPGIPGGMAFVAPPVIIAFLGIPAAVEPAYYAIWAGFGVGLSDQFRTGVNTCDNGLVALLFEKWYPKHFAKPGVAPVPAGVGEAPGAVTVPVETPEASSAEAENREPPVERQR